MSPGTMTGRAIDIGVGVVPQEAPAAWPVEAILGILGVPHSPSSPGNVCVIDTRERASSSGTPEAAAPESTVFFDDFLAPRRVLGALQGRPETPSGPHASPDISSGAAALFQAMKEKFRAKGLPLVAKGYWPKDAPGCLVLTHDVDWFDYSPFHKAVWKGKPFSQYLRLLLRYAAGQRFGPNIASIIELENSFGANSTFLFRNVYPSAQEKLAGAVRVCRDSGREVALHAAKKSHRIPEAMVKEKSEIELTLGRPVHGLREHALKFEHDKTWKCIEGAGFEYDMTFGLNEKTGFIAGLCHPYRPVDLGGKAHSFFEIPTSLMDWTAIRQGVRGEGLETLVRGLRETTEGLQGCLCVNFHNTYIDKDLFPDIEKAYRLLMAECVRAGFWVATAQECAEWWTRRDRSSLVARIVGGSLEVEAGDPAVTPRVFWPDGRVEPWGQISEVEGP